MLYGYVYALSCECDNLYERVYQYYMLDNICYEMTTHEGIYSSNRSNLWEMLRRVEINQKLIGYMEISESKNYLRREWLFGLSA